MNKIISTLTISAFLGISGLFASVDSALNPAESKERKILSQADSEFLFGTSNLNDINAEILSQKELEETQGEFWNFVKGGIDTAIYFFKETKKAGWWNFRF